jgi:opacity protein-like surface antigen
LFIKEHRETKAIKALIFLALFKNTNTKEIMMKRYIKNGLAVVCFITSLSLATSALAIGLYQGQEKPYFDGFYAGLGGGVVHSQANVEDYFSAKTAGGDPGLSLNHTLDLGKHGVNGNIFAGFGKTLKSCYYLGFELFGNLFSQKMEGSFTAKNILKLSSEVKNPYSLGGDIRAGYLVFPRVMLYVLFGLDYAKFEVENTYADIGVTPGKMANDFNKWRWGYMPGAGIEVGLAHHLSLRAQYTYTIYNSFSRSITERRPENLNELWTLKTKVDPERSLFTLKLSYLFN